MTDVSVMVYSLRNSILAFLPLRIDMSSDNVPMTIMSTQVLINAIKDKIYFWRTKNQEPYADVENGLWRRSIPIDGAAFRSWLYTVDPNKMPRPSAVDAVVEWCAAKAAESGNIHDINYRVGLKENVLYYDLGRIDNKLVEFKGGTWEVVPASKDSPRFVRTPGVLEQVMPVATTKTLQELLKPLVPVKTEGDLSLIIGWLMSCFKPGGPFPVLVINGEQGSAKSSTMRLLRKIIDPHSRDMVEPPGSPRDLVAVVKNGYVFAIDNMSKMPPWLSDSLCRLSTGTGAIGGRRLYTTDEMSGFQAARPTMLNGIPAFVEREDLSDRSIHLELPEIPDNKRRDDDSYWQEVNAAMPEILGALFNAVAKAQVGWDKVRLESAPRMSNFVRWVVAGQPQAENAVFLEAYARKRKDVTEEFVEHSEVAQGVIGLLNARKDGVWCGTLVQLLMDLEGYAPSRRSFWPENSWQLSARLARLKPELRKMGVEIIKNGRQAGTGRARVEIRKSADFSERGFAVSTSA